MSVVAPTITAVLGSCCACVFYLEQISSEQPGAMNLLTFAEFLFISLEGIFLTTRFFTIPNAIPIRRYLAVAGVFGMVNVINNQALNYHIPVPLHIIFRSGSLFANMVLGMWLLKRRYTAKKYLSVVMITAGIITCTLASAQPAKENATQGDDDGTSAHRFYVWSMGIAMLTFALFFSALLGIMQERLYAEFGKHPRESMFYSHFIPLPAFALFAGDIWKNILIFNESAPIDVPYTEYQMPKMWYYLLWSVITQYVCIRTIYVLTTECPSLTVTLVITLRKFISLILSIVIFRNPFTLTHWLGTALVFGGTLLFADVWGQIKTALAGSTATEKGKEE